MTERLMFVTSHYPEMMPGSVIMSEGFTLMDAMSAFEVGYISGHCGDLG